MLDVAFITFQNLLHTLFTNKAGLISSARCIFQDLVNDNVCARCLWDIYCHDNRNIDWQSGNPL